MKYRKPQKHNRGIEIAKLLFPELIIEPPGTWWDRVGIDGFLGEDAVQIKFDGRIALSRNIYHEIYEKSAYHPEQPWRVAVGKVTHYIFTTEDATEIRAILLSVNELAEIERNKPLRCISPNTGAPTSSGFIIPYDEIALLARVKSRNKEKLNNARSIETARH